MERGAIYLQSTNYNKTVKDPADKVYIEVSMLPRFLYPTGNVPGFSENALSTINGLCYRPLAKGSLNGSLLEAIEPGTKPFAFLNDPREQCNHRRVILYLRRPYLNSFGSRRYHD